MGLPADGTPYGRLLAQNTVLNLLGHGAPLVVALFAVPPIIRGLGTEAYGVLSLAWMLVGYLSLFDLGLGQALTRFVAWNITAGKEHESPASVWTGISLMVLLGLAGAAAGWAVSPWLVREVIKIPPALRPETLAAFRLLSVSIPFVISTTAFQGVLAAYQRFGIISALRIPMGLVTFLGPLAVLPFSRSIYLIVSVLVAGRIIICLAHVVSCLKAVPVLRSGFVFHIRKVVPLLRFGGWMTVCNILGPLMSNADRFLIGALLSVTAVAYYTTPYDLITRLNIIPWALAGVLFPAFSSNFSYNRDRTGRIFVRGVKYVFLLLFPIVFLAVTFAHEGLGLWLGGEFAREGTRVLQLMAIATLMFSIARVPFALVQGAGKPVLLAKLLFAQAVLYIPALWWAVKYRGIEGAAMVCMIRMTAEMAALFIMAGKILPEAVDLKKMAFIMCAAILTLVLASMPAGLLLKGLLVLAVSVAFAAGSWFHMLARDEREMVQRYFKLATFSKQP